MIYLLTTTFDGVLTELSAQARELVHCSNGIQKTRDLAQNFCNIAKDAIQIFPDTEARAGLEEVLNKVLTRKK